MGTRVHPTAEVCVTAKIGEGTQIWHHAQVRERASLGKSCILGKNVYIDFEVEIGDNCKIQNNASVFHGAKLGNGVFLGPHVALLNDRIPRAVNPDGSQKSAADWAVSGVTIEEGASIGARATLLPGVRIGKWALVGAGAVVTKDVPEHALVYGNPARVRGYVDRSGRKMSGVKSSDNTIVYRSEDGTFVRQNGTTE